MRITQEGGNPQTGCAFFFIPVTVKFHNPEIIDPDFGIYVVQHVKVKRVSTPCMKVPKDCKYECKPSEEITSQCEFYEMFSGDMGGGKQGEIIDNWQLVGVNGDCGSFGSLSASTEVRLIRGKHGVSFPEIVGDDKQCNPPINTSPSTPNKPKTWDGAKIRSSANATHTWDCCDKNRQIDFNFSSTTD